MRNLDQTLHWLLSCRGKLGGFIGKHHFKPKVTPIFSDPITFFFAVLSLPPSLLGPVFSFCVCFTHNFSLVPFPLFPPSPGPVCRILVWPSYWNNNSTIISKLNILWSFSFSHITTFLSLSSLTGNMYEWKKHFVSCCLNCAWHNWYISAILNFIYRSFAYLKKRTVLLELSGMALVMELLFLFCLLYFVLFGKALKLHSHLLMENSEKCHPKYMKASCPGFWTEGGLQL